MFGKPIQLFRLAGFPIRLDPSWFIIFLLVIWSLAAFYFPTVSPNLEAATYWWMGITGAVGLFASVVLHELGHALVARRYNLPIRGITLFLFGGVAEMEEEPRSAKAEFLVAVAGPFVTLLIAAITFGLTALAQAVSWPVSIISVLAYIWTINVVLLVVNLIPAFPLDGGRVLRSALWKAQGNLRKATRISSRVGSGFGLFLIVLGIFSFFMGNLIGGIWTALIGLFLRNAAGMSYRQLLMRQALEGEPVNRFMTTDPVSVPSRLSIQELVDRYIYQHAYKLFPVEDNGQLVGCVTVGQIKDLPRNEWDTLTVDSVMDSCSNENTIHAESDAMEALSQMHRTGRSRLLVTYGEKLVGILTLKDLMRFFSTRVELEGDMLEDRSARTSVRQEHSKKEKSRARNEQPAEQT